MIDPCRMCYLYPHNCPTICITKMKYVNELDEDVPIIRKQKKKRVFDNNYNKNGIRREIR